MILKIVKANESESSVILKHEEYWEKMKKIHVWKSISRFEQFEWSHRYIPKGIKRDNKEMTLLQERNTLIQTNRKTPKLRVNVKMHSLTAHMTNFIFHQCTYI